MILSLAELREDIRRRLGGTKRCVELEDEDIDTAITKAVDELTRYFPGESIAALTSASPAQKRYVISHKGLLGVTDVFFMDPLQASDRITDNPFLNVNLSGFYFLGDAYASEIYLQLGYMEDLRRTLSSDPEWECNWEYNETEDKREYALYVDVPQGYTQYYVSYRYVWGYEASDDKQRGLPSIPRPFEAWIRDYARACAQETLGDVRNKFGGIPLADGGNSETDGATLIDRAVQKQESLIEDLTNRQRPPTIVIG